MRLSGAADLEEDPDFEYALPAERGTDTSVGFRVVVHDPARFARGLAELRRGLDKPFYRSYTAQFVRRRLALATPRDLTDEARAMAIAAGTPLPMLGDLRQLTPMVMAHAARLIQKGRTAEAAEWIDMAPVPGTQVTTGAEFLIEALVGRHMRRTALCQGAALYERMGREDGTDAAMRRAQRDRQVFLRTIGGPAHRSGPPHGRQPQALLARHALAPLPGVSSDAVRAFAHLARAERFFLERAALGLLCLVFLVLLVVAAAVTAVGLWRHRKDTRGPKLLFIGWPRLARVLGLAVGLPLLGYALWTRALPFGSTQTSLVLAVEHLAWELLITAGLILGLTLGLGYRAIRARCRELGMEPPTVRSRARAWLVRLAWCVVAAAALVLFLASLDLWVGLGSIALSFLLVGLVVLIIARTPDARPTVVRSMLPVLVSCLLVLGLVGRGYLARAEQAAVARFQRYGHTLLLDELAYTSAHEYQEYLRALPTPGMP